MKMTMIYCNKNNSKTMPFKVNNPYNAEYIGDGLWKIYGDDMSIVLTPLDGYYIGFDEVQ